MAKAFAKGFYKSKAWEDCREAYIKYCGGLCERCLAEGIYTAGVIVHHKKYLTPDNICNPSVATDFSNLELLCQACHNKEHHGEKNKNHQKRFLVGPNGEIVPFDRPPV